MEIPEYVPGDLVESTDSCISVCTQADVDGAVTIRQSNKKSEIEEAISDFAESLKVFEGTLSSPSLRVGIHSSEVEKLLEVSVETQKALVAIWVDDSRWPSKVFVMAQ